MAFAVMLCLVSFAWILARIWKSSTLLAVACLVCWPVVLCALLRNWDDREHDVRVPVTAFGLALAYGLWVLEAQRYAA